MADLILVLNLGLKSVRSIIFDLEGRKLAHASLPVQTSLKGDRVEQDPEEWWRKALSVMQETARSRGLGQQVSHLTVTSSSSCLTPVTASGKPTCPAIMVSDKRAETQAARMAQHEAFRAVEQAVGHHADASLMLPKILWLQEHDPERAQASRWFLSPNDYLNLCLTGRVLTDSYNAHKFHYDLVCKTYPDQLLEVLRIPEERLPEVHTPGTVIGPVLSEVAGRIGLRPNVEVVLSTYDAICAFHGSGPSGPGEACDVSGTVSSLRAYAEQIDTTELNGLQCVPWLDSRLSILGGSNNLGGGLIEWAKQCFFSREDYPYEVMEKEARETSFGARGLIFLPYLMGERAPLWDSAARGVYFGLERYHTRGDMAEAVLQSAGFTIRSLLEAIEKCGPSIQRIRVSGGLTRVSHVSELKADITGREIAVVDEFETTALGAALIAAVGTGALPDMSEASRRVRVRMVIHPDPTRHRVFDQLFSLYQDTYQALKPLFVKRRRILSELHEVVEASITNL
jgi:xylulokinase